MWNYQGRGSGRAHPAFEEKPAEVPDGVWWIQVGSRRRYQLEPNAPPQEPSGLALFNNSNDTDIVEYPRYLREPMVDCGNGHKVYLSRTPWQSGCRECTVPGWNHWMQVLFVCVYRLNRR